MWVVLFTRASYIVLILTSMTVFFCFLVLFCFFFGAPSKCQVLGKLGAKIQHKILNPDPKDQIFSSDDICIDDLSLLMSSFLFQVLNWKKRSKSCHGLFPASRSLLMEPFAHIKYTWMRHRLSGLIHLYILLPQQKQPPLLVRQIRSIKNSGYRRQRESMGRHLPL